VTLDQLHESLQAAGARVELITTGSSRGLAVGRLPPEAQLEGVSGEGVLWVVEGEIDDLLEPGARVLGNGLLRIGTLSIPVVQVAAAVLRSAGLKIGEAPDNLARRAGWFGKRRGPPQTCM
jgi:hypothetical protein